MTIKNSGLMKSLIYIKHKKIAHHQVKDNFSRIHKSQLVALVWCTKN